MVGEINDVVLKDREILSEDGIITASIALDHSRHIILGDPVISAKGFLYEDNNDLFEVLKEIIRNCTIFLMLILTRTPFPYGKELWN